MSTPIVADGLVIVGTGTNQVLKDNWPVTIWGRAAGDYVVALSQRDGHRVWAFHTVGEDMPTPALIGNRLVFSNGDMHAYAIDIVNGKLLWKIPIPGVTTMSATATAPGLAFVVASHGLSYMFAKDASHMIAIDPANGRVVWSAVHGNADCSPTVSKGLVICEGSEYVWYGPSGIGWMGRNDVEAYSIRDGRQVWRWVGAPGYYTSVGSSERGIAGMAHNGVLYQSVPTLDEMLAVRVTDGKILWTFHTAGQVKMSSVYWNGILIFGDTSGLLYAVDAKTGEIDNIIARNKPFATSPPVIVGKTLFIANAEVILAIPLSDLVL